MDIFIFFLLRQPNHKFSKGILRINHQMAHATTNRETAPLFWKFSIISLFNGLIFPIRYKNITSSLNGFIYEAFHDQTHWQGDLIDEGSINKNT